MFGRKNSKPTNQESILLVDDDKGQLDVFMAWMGAVRPSAHLQTATNAAEAAELLNSTRFSLVISDYSMPHPAAGLDVLAAAKDSGLPVSQFIMLSGTTDNLPDGVRLVSKGDLPALEAAIEQALK